MTFEQLVTSIRACLPDPAATLGPDDSLIGTGAVDSLTFFDFIGSIERRFEIQIPESVLFGNGFNTLGDVARVVAATKGW